MTLAEPDPEALPDEPLDYRAGAYYALRFALVVAWLVAAYFLFAIAVFGFGHTSLDPGAPPPHAAALRRHADFVLALDVLLGVQTAGALALWLLRRRPVVAAALLTVTVVLAMCTFGLRTPPA
ncbi:hypothetical protein [Catellatospora sp. NPDC049609]|uniref:hypothetical protein n=1 Tax=Catellatospora sp. NPDC049609 TaxID=3155505 RepID=UPI003423488F